MDCGTAQGTKGSGAVPGKSPLTATCRGLVRIDSAPSTVDTVLGQEWHHMFMPISICFVPPQYRN